MEYLINGGTKMSESKEYYQMLIKNMAKTIFDYLPDVRSEYTASEMTEYDYSKWLTKKIISVYGGKALQRFEDFVTLDEAKLKEKDYKSHIEKEHKPNTEEVYEFRAEVGDVIVEKDGTTGRVKAFLPLGDDTYLLVYNKNKKYDTSMCLSKEDAMRTFKQIGSWVNPSYRVNKTEDKPKSTGYSYGDWMKILGIAIPDTNKKPKTENSVVVKIYHQ